MGRRTRRLFKSTKDKEAKFVACLLVNGPPPDHTDFSSDGASYKQQVMDWWRASHNSQPMITDSGVHRFYNRYKRWLSEERYRRSKGQRDEQAKT